MPRRKSGHKSYKKGYSMNKSRYFNVEELPIFLDAKAVANVLGISMTGTYQLMKRDDFPTIRIGNRPLVKRDKFLEWVDNNSQGNN